MALSDIEMQAEIREKRLVIDPPIPVESDRIGSSSIDLLLYKELTVVGDNGAAGIVVDPTAPGFQVMPFLQRNGRKVTIPDNGSYEMPPNQLVIGRTLESVKLPLHLAGRIEGKSSLARLGLSVHVTAPSIHAGFAGPLYLEMNNIGPYRILLRREMEIAQLILEHTGLPALAGYEGQFQQQV